MPVNQFLEVSLGGMMFISSPLCSVSEEIQTQFLVSQFITYTDLLALMKQWVRSALSCL